MLHVAFEIIVINGQKIIDPLDFPAYDYYKLL